MINIIRIITIVFITVIASHYVNAQQISQAQIEQFKKLPPSQQEALAKSMGVDISALQNQISGGSSQEQVENTQSYPRGTEFDAKGEPITQTQEEEEEEEFADEDKLFQELPRFGLDVFANAPSTFAPVNDIAIPEGYILGTGDSVNIQVFGKDNMELELSVNRQGALVLPRLGPINVSGLSFSELKLYLASEIKKKIIGVEVVVSLAKLRSMRVFVLGDAYKPGPYTLSSLSSVTHAIFAAGGISDIGSLRNIQVKRAGKLIQKVDLYDLLIHGDSSSDILLRSGDVVFIPSQGRSVSVSGEVRRPAIYDLNETDDFSSVIAMAGGLLPSAYPKSTIVERFNQSNLRSIINIDLSNKAQLASKVQTGDFIRVLKSAEKYSGSVTLIGAVSRPGKYQLLEQMRISDLLPHVDTHLLQHADLNYGIVVREIDAARNIEVLQFNLTSVLSDLNSIDNISLAKNDKVLVFSSFTKSIDQKYALDELAYTEEELFAKERSLAKTSFKSKNFWNKYGENGSKFDTTTDEEKATQELLNQSLAQVTGGEVEEELDIREVALFSRQRLLVPILKKLRQQGASGQPIKLVEVDGEVKFPGIYPLAKNAKVKQLITAAGGVNEAAYLTRAEITRNVVDMNGATKTSLNLNLASALNNNAADNIALKSKDRLNIHKIPAWSENHVVELRGEFVFPGKYTVRRGDKLSDLIKKAGGYTNFAHVEGSVFSRMKLKELEQQNMFKMAADLRAEMASKSLSDSSVNNSYADIQSLLSDLTKFEPIGRLVIDLPNIGTENTYDVLLEGGDVLYVPTKKNSVNVIGQVQVNSSHMLDLTMDAEDYILQSGGLKKRADDDRIYIISANGRIKMLEGDDNWFSSGGSSGLKPGDTIVVPLDSEYMNNLTLWTTATTIMYNTAVAVAAISGI
jgi:polysaccharide export outer membrane protein